MASATNLDSLTKNAPLQISIFQKYAPQVLVTLTISLYSSVNGMNAVFISIFIPSLLRYSENLDSDETIKMTKSEISWLANIVFIGHATGSIFLGYFAESFGRKNLMLVTPFTITIGYLILSLANSATMVHVGFFLLGFVEGLLPIVFVFLTEISEPHMRGILMSIANLVASSRIFITFLFGSFLSWRNVALICSIIPIVGFFSVLFIPESSIYLLSKQQHQEALKSLQFYRGWVPAQNVTIEFKELQRYFDWSNACKSCRKINKKCVHPPPINLDKKFKDLIRKRSLKPIGLLMVLHIFMLYTGTSTMRSDVVPIMNAYGIPIDPYVMTILFSLITGIGGILLICIVRMSGKRNIYLISMFASALCSFGLSIYGLSLFPSGWSSSSEDIDSIMKFQIKVGELRFVALVFFLISNFFYTLGISTIPVFMAFEILPLRSRSYYVAFLSIMIQIHLRISNGTYRYVENWFSMPGAALINGLFNTIGLVMMYLVLPETEGKTMEEIEVHFADNNRKIDDINIRKILRDNIKPDE